MSARPLEPYDAVLLVSFGGPDGADDVIPFLRRVTRGRNIPDERLAVVGEHYFLFGGVSPINARNRELLQALRDELSHRGAEIPVYWGNRNARPYIVDALADAYAEGARRIVVILTSAYASYSSCRQYRENLAEAVDQLGYDDLIIDKIRPYGQLPAFTETMADLVAATVAQAKLSRGDRAALVHVTHSIPDEMNERSGPSGHWYLDQQRAIATAITERVNHRLGLELATDIAFCSRSGAPHHPWLEPDINDRIRELADQGVGTVIAHPIGFIADHMEVVYDLDTEAAATAQELGLSWHRVPTVESDPRFVSGLIDLVFERAAEAGGHGTESDAWPLGANLPSTCGRSCCDPGTGRPTVCGVDA